MSGPPRHRTAAIRVGDRVLIEAVEHTVVGLSGTSVRLLDPAGQISLVTLTHLLTVAEFLAPTTGRSPRLRGLGLLEAAPDAATTRARWWQGHVLEVETGRAPGHAHGDPRAGYDPATTTLAEREHTKAQELSALGHAVSARTVRRRRAAFAASGLWGLVDRRTLRGSSATGRVDARVVEAIKAAMAEQTQASTGTRGRLRRRVGQLLEHHHGSDTVALPPRSTFYRLLRGLDGGEHTFESATTRRSLAARPTPPFGTLHTTRPGAWMQIDTTALDVLAELEPGVTTRVELTMLADQATRSIGSGVLRPHGTKAVDAALLLARALVPEPMRPGWPDALRMRASRLPHTQLSAVDQRLREAAARPVIVPENIVCDHGKAFESETFQAACHRLGISLQPAHPGTATDKPMIERGFGSVGTLFSQYVVGYTGRDPTRRARGLDHQPLWSLEELQDLFDQWVLTGWQPRPHEGLRHPEIPRSALSPNEMYAALVAAAGYVPLALTDADYLELLPVAWRRIGAGGVAREHLSYDCTDLNPYRGQRSPWTAQRGRWPVHYDPYDLSRVWLRGTDPSTWIEVPWRHRDRVPGPFADFTLRHVRAVLAERDQHQASEQAVADALEQLLRRAETGPDRPRTAQRVAAKTRAATPAACTGVEPDPGDDDPVEAEVPEPAEPAERGEGGEGADEVVTDERDAVAGFGVFDARLEARRFW